jgi:hypothetical protein
MIARFVGRAIILFSLADGMAQPAGLPVDSSRCGAHVDANESGGSQASVPSQSSVTQGARTTDAKQSPRAADQTQRARELIYFFRNYRVFCRDEEWAQTIRELATIGKAAVPELVAELDRTDRDATLRSLAFCLRAIDDPRAVPALIRAIPKALRRGTFRCQLRPTCMLKSLVVEQKHCVPYSQMVHELGECPEIAKTFDRLADSLLYGIYRRDRRAFRDLTRTLEQLMFGMFLNE